MQAWKPFLIIVPAGLLLGAVGGHYARPVLTQRLDDGALQSVFQTRAQRNGTTDQTQLDDATYYAGAYSYPPYLDDRMGDGDREITGWQGPSFADWPDYEPAPMPTIAQLEAEVAARDAALGRQASSESATGGQSPAEAASAAAADAAANAADEARVGDPAAQDSSGASQTVTGPAAASARAPSPEPRSADGALPAIW